MRKRIAITAIIAMAVTTLAGCASIPDMTDEQTELVSEYATALLLKYDKENHSRLVDTSSFMNSYVAAMQLYNATKEKYESEQAAIIQDEAERREEVQNQTTANEEYNKEAEEGTEGEPIPVYNDGTGGATVVSATSVSDYLGAGDFSFDYTGYRLMKSYPENGSSDVYFVIDATKGNDLLVVYFDVTNNSNGKAKLDVFNKEAVFRLSVNGSGEKTTFKTMLEDDLSEYLGEFGANETKQLVLLLEVKEGTEVNNLSMSIALPGKDSIKKILN